MDFTAAVARVWRLWAEKHGLEPETVVREAHGRRSVETVRALAPNLDAERENAMVESMEIADRDGVVALPGAARVLNALPPERFAIVTSATRALAVARLSYAGLPVPRNFVTADDVSEGKPSPQPFLQGAALLGLAPSDGLIDAGLIFEDTPAGIESARRAGMSVVALTTTFPPHQLVGANAIIASLEEVRVGIEPGAIRVEAGAAL